jgi:hypothetical protein
MIPLPFLPIDVRKSYYSGQDAPSPKGGNTRLPSGISFRVQGASNGELSAVNLTLQRKVLFPEVSVNSNASIGGQSNHRTIGNQR